MGLSIGCITHGAGLGVDLVVAVARFGGPAFIDVAGLSREGLQQTLARLVASGVEFGFAAPDVRELREVVESAPGSVRRLLLTDAARLDGEAVRALWERGIEVWAEVRSVAEAAAAEAAGAAKLVLKGNESGGRVGEDTTLILLQKLRRSVKTPLIARGGVGLHTAAACYVAGAEGVLLDWQLALCEEAAPSPALRKKLERMDGSETVVLGQDIGRRYRLYLRPGETKAAELAERAGKIRPDAEDFETQAEAWSRAVEEAVQNGEALALGQDACFAKSLAERFRTAAGVCEAIRREATRHTRVA